MGGSVAGRTAARAWAREFRVRLPAAPPRRRRRPRPPLPTAAPPAAARRAGMRLLYIEDNPVNALIVQELVALRADTMRCTSPPTGSQRRAAGAGADPDLVLVDMQLPDIDGFEVLRRLRASRHRPRAPCASCCRRMRCPTTSQRALRAGFDDYWTKPIDFNQFLAGLDRLAEDRSVQPSVQ